MINHHSFCSNFFKNSLLIDYIYKTLEEEMVTSMELGEEDIWFILDSIVGALSFLQSKSRQAGLILQHGNLRFSTIYIVHTPSNVKLFKLVDKQFLQYDSLYNYARENSKDPHKMISIYLSPEQLFALKKDEKNPTYNVFKSDVFTAGMLLAHLCLWKSLQDIYDFK